MKRSRVLRFGILLALLLGGLFLFMRASAGPDVEPGSTLLVSLSGAYVEAPESPLLARLAGQPRKPFASVLSLFALAERDARITTVVVRIRNLEIGWGKAQELRSALERLTEAGKRTIAHLELVGFAGNREYYIASAAEEVYVVPGGSVAMLGLAAETLYFGEMWEKLGVEIEMLRVGRYKSAIESIAEARMSEDTRAMLDSMLESLERIFVSGVARGRAIEQDDVFAAIARGPVLGRELDALGLVDGVRNLEDVLADLEGPVVKSSDYQRVDPASVGIEFAARYALVYATGDVVSGKGNSTPFGAPVVASETLAQALRDAAKDPEIEAIILRLDSPGGSALASELIWRSVREAVASGKPVIASFSDVAASGGYYIAAAADTIVSPGGAITGSIGAFMLRPTIGGALDKAGIHAESVTRGKHADFFLSGAPLSKGSRERLQRMLVDTYDLFVERVASGRSLAAGEVDAVGQGRVWTGAQALDVGLVDELGGLRDAVRAAKRAHGIDVDADVALVTFPKAKPLAEQLGELLELRFASWARAALPLPEPAQRLERWVVSLPFDTPLLVPPFALEIH